MLALAFSHAAAYDPLSHRVWWSGICADSSEELRRRAAAQARIRWRTEIVILASCGFVFMDTD